MDLQLEIVGKPGRGARELWVEFERELTPGDVALVQVNRETEPSHVKRLTDRHHTVARLLAGGMAEGEVAAVTGYTLSRISILKADPTFNELLKVYRANKDMEFKSTFAKLAGVAQDALDLISERMEDEAERAKITVPQALEIAKLGTDRTGHGPASTNTTVNVHVGLAERMEAARRKAMAASEPRVIEAVPREAAE